MILFSIPYHLIEAVVEEYPLGGHDVGGGRNEYDSHGMPYQ